ncbi:MAG: A/G-specific adenine glycosylase [Bdellovibrionales bacterium]|nr:A/G-specific adenine glycosylase [Bdellovibrionales bacterium]
MGKSVKKTNSRERKTPVLPESKKLAQVLVDWYAHNHRDLPWRKSRDPYRIWISEVMLQQTTSQAVIPYYHRFMEKFPTVDQLADAPLPQVLEAWAGLGYYSRARNLHKAAQLLSQNGFPKTYSELIELPGFGPYTARAVSSLAFDEAVGVLDGNVIRTLSRYLGEKIEWWTTAGRDRLQTAADELAQANNSHNVNQAMMEMGATMCTPKSPSCFLCPWNKGCEARRQGLQDQLPLRKEKKEGLRLLWTPSIFVKDRKIALAENNYAPFLKKAKIFPGKVEVIKDKPKSFTYKHSITKYEIFIQLPETLPTKVEASSDVEWIALKDVKKTAPYNLVLKALNHLKLLNNN